MRLKYLALSGWLLADLGLALAFVGLGDSPAALQSAPSTSTTSSAANAGPEVGEKQHSDGDCLPGLEQRPHHLVVDLQGLPGVISGQLKPPPAFAESIREQARLELTDQGISDERPGLIQTFTTLRTDGTVSEVQTSLWVNDALLGLPQADELGPALPEKDPLADLRVRNFIGNETPDTALVEWFVIKECA